MIKRPILDHVNQKKKGAVIFVEVLFGFMCVFIL